MTQLKWYRRQTALGGGLDWKEKIRRSRERCPLMLVNAPSVTFSVGMGQSEDSFFPFAGDWGAKTAVFVPKQVNVGTTIPTHVDQNTGAG